MREKTNTTRFLFYLSSFLLSAAIFFAVSIITGNGLFGEYTVLKWDAIVQYVNFLGYYMDVLKGQSKELFYSLSITPGGDTTLLWGYYLLSPFNLIVLLFDKATLPEAFFWIECAKFSTAGLFMGVFLLHLAERKNAALEKHHYVMLLALSSAYSCGGFTFAYPSDTLWFDAILILPLLADGIYKLVLDGKCLQYFLCLLYGIITNFYCGFILCILSLLLAAYLTLIHRNMGVKLFARFAISSVLAAAASSVVIIPCVAQVFSSKLGESTDSTFRLRGFCLQMPSLIMGMLLCYGLYRLFNSDRYNKLFSSWKRYVADTVIVAVTVTGIHLALTLIAGPLNYRQNNSNFIFRFLTGGFNLNEYQTSDLMCIYAGLLVAGLVLAYFFDYRFDKRKKLIDFEAILLCFFLMGFVDLNYVIHGFNRPAGNMYRWAYGFIFFMVLLAADYYLDERRRQSFSVKRALGSHMNYVLTVLILTMIIVAGFTYKRLGFTYLSWRTCGINVLFFAIYYGIIIAGMRHEKAPKVLLPLVLVTELIVNGVISADGFEYLPKARYDAYMDVSSQIMEDVRTQGDKDLFRQEWAFEKPWNYIAGYNSIYHYSSAYIRKNYYFMDKFGMAGDPALFNYTRVQNNFDLSPQDAGFLGIRYLVTEEPQDKEGYTLLNSYTDPYAQKEYYLYKNEYALPLAFAADGEGFKGIGTGLLQTGYSTYTCEGDFLPEQDLIIALPYTEGWTAYVDGQETEIHEALDFFISVTPGAGKHTVEVKYKNKYLLFTS